MKELSPWVSVIVLIVGLIGQGYFGSFRLGQAVEQVKAALKEYIDDERDKVLEKIDELEKKFADEQKSQDHNFGEVGAAMREKIAQVEQHLRQVELYGERHYVQKGEFEKAIDRLGETFKTTAAEIKEDLRDRIDDLRKSFEAKH